MTFRSWIATCAEIGSLIADHVGEGFSGIAKAIDPPVTIRWSTDSDGEDVTADDLNATYTIELTPGAVCVGWCSTCLVSHAFLDMYIKPDEPPVATWADHNEEDQ